MEHTRPEQRTAGVAFGMMVFLVSAIVSERLLIKIKQHRQRREIVCKLTQLKDPFFD